MAKGAAKASADLQVADNGTFTVTLKFLDADGVPATTPVGLAASYAGSDSAPGPSVLTLAPAADMASAAGSINQATVAALIAAGLPLPTGVTVNISITAGLAGQAAPVSIVAAPPIDVVAGPAVAAAGGVTTP